MLLAEHREPARQVMYVAEEAVQMFCTGGQTRHVRVSDVIIEIDNGFVSSNDPVVSLLCCR